MLSEEERQVVSLIKKGIDLPELVEIALYNRKPRAYSFEEFLVNDRLLVFARMKLLFELALKSDCKIGHGKIEYDQFPSCDEEKSTTRTLEPSVLRETFSIKQAFNYLIPDFTQLIREDLANVHTSDREFVTSSPEGWGSHHSAYPKEEVMVTTNRPYLIVTQTAVHVESHLVEETKAILRGCAESFDQFLEEAANAPSVPHEWYIKWLLTWFPGMIKVRTLPSAATQPVKKKSCEHCSCHPHPK
jgi:hypothetical protein